MRSNFSGGLHCCHAEGRETSLLSNIELFTMIFRQCEDSFYCPHNEMSIRTALRAFLPFPAGSETRSYTVAPLLMLVTIVVAPLSAEFSAHQWIDKDQMERIKNISGGVLSRRLKKYVTCSFLRLPVYSSPSLTFSQREKRVFKIFFYKNISWSLPKRSIQH